MHILLVSNYPPPYEGGIQFVLGQLYDRCVRLGHRATIVASDTGIPKNPTRTLVGVPASNWLEQHSIPFPLFDPLRLIRALNRLLPETDAVHVHGLLYMSSLFAAIMARRRGIPVVLTEHVGMVDYHQPVLNLIQRIAFHTLGRLCVRAADAVVVLNERVYGEMQPLIRRGTPLLKVPNGVDTALFYSPTTDERPRLRAKWGFAKPTILFVGRLVKKKGIDLVVAAARLAPEWDFAICGKDTELLETDLPNVRVIGKVDQPTLRELYGAADVFLLPSEGEGFPLSVQEALACALPVVVSDDPTNREYLDETVAAFAARQPEAISAAIRSIIGDEDHRAAMSAAAYAWALAHFDWEVTVQKYLELYQG
ncbi:MAG: glycosyltransferase family 4 protein [Anaerolinea sp.]|nr:glycosyltransferase family 4 protein [Anaerolinea sp.]